MMIQALYELAQREKLLEDPDYEEQRVDLIISIDADGKYLGLIANGGAKLGEGNRMKIPRLPGTRTSGMMARLLCDNAKYVLGLEKAKDEKAAKPERVAECAALFAQEVRNLASQTEDVAVIAVERFLRSLDSVRSLLIQDYPFGGDGFTGSETIAFRFAPSDELVHRRDSVRNFFSRSREKQQEGIRQLQCLVTGQHAPVSRLHPLIKGVPAAQPTGAALVSFNADAFASYGLKGGENAPMSRAVAEGYVTALNYLLQRVQVPTPDGKKTVSRYRQGVSMGDAVTVFWTKQPHPIEEDVMSCFGEGVLVGDSSATDESRQKAENRARLLSDAIFNGHVPGTATVPFYAVTLSGNAARVVVRDWLETTAEQVYENLKRYFLALHIGHRQPEPIPLRPLLAALVFKERDLPPSWKGALLRAAFFGDRLPDALLIAALQRLRLPPDKYDKDQLRLRCGVIKALLIQRKSFQEEITVSLNEQNHEPAYLCGRLFAILEQLQSAAIKDANTTIRERYFGAASMTPALIFPRLLSLSNHHAKKSGRGDLEKLKGRVMAQISDQGFPRLLSMDGQGLFAIGYYHQREARFDGSQRTAKDDAETRSEPTG